MKYFGEENSLAIDLDDYLVSRSERGRLGLTGYQPGANKLDLAREHIQALKTGKTIEKPVYNHTTGDNSNIEVVHARPLLIFEGVTTLYPQLDDLYSISIFLDALEETQIKSRIERDVNKRGYSLDEALALYENLKPHYQKHIEPTKEKATIIAEVGPDYVIHRKR
jgi:phosphoribulokinase